MSGPGRERDRDGHPSAMTTDITTIGTVPAGRTAVSVEECTPIGRAALALRRHLAGHCGAFAVSTVLATDVDRVDRGTGEVAVLVTSAETGHTVQVVRYPVGGFYRVTHFDPAVQAQRPETAAGVVLAACDAFGVDRPGSYSRDGAARTRVCGRCGATVLAWESDCRSGGGGEHHRVPSVWAT